MSEFFITSSVNAGISININGSKVWVDALHRVKESPRDAFSVVTPERFEVLKEHEDFKDPDVIYYTHFHPDHYSRSYTAEALKLWPNAKLISPMDHFESQEVITGDYREYEVNGIKLECYRVLHEEKMFYDDPHYAAVISKDGMSVLVTGDTEIASGSFDKVIKGRHFDAAVFDFPWGALPKGRKYIEENLDAGTLIFNHFPLEEDDKESFRTAAVMIRKKFADRDIRLMLDAFQKEVIEL